MPDPIRTSDIDDVLSSIRRLVADEIQPLKRRVDLDNYRQQEAHALKESQGEKLVLSPAQRVTEARQHEGAEAASSRPLFANGTVHPKQNGAPKQAAEAPADVDLEEAVIKEFGADDFRIRPSRPLNLREAVEADLAKEDARRAKAGQADAFSAAAEADDEDDEAEKTVAPFIRHDLRRAMEAPVEEAEVAEETKPAPITLTEAARVNAEDAEAEEEPVKAIGAIEEEAEEAEAELAQDLETVENDVEAVKAFIKAEPEKPILKADPWESISLEDRIAELEAAVSQSDDEWEPDGSEVAGPPNTFEELEAESLIAGSERASGMNAASAILRPRAPEPAHTAPRPEPAKAAPEPVVEPVAEAQAETAEEEETTLLDEATLRDMVADIVRAELQGELGERITRNVRKLVRREINRALASRDFE